MECVSLSLTAGSELKPNGLSLLYLEAINLSWDNLNLRHSRSVLAGI